MNGHEMFEEELNSQQIAEKSRETVISQIDDSIRSQLGQFMTPPETASFMAGMFTRRKENQVRILDPGAGVGMLSAALIRRLISLRNKPESIELVLYEVSEEVANEQLNVLNKLRKECRAAGVAIEIDQRVRDFILHSAEIRQDLLAQEEDPFSHIIMNPPYKKINSASMHRTALRQLGIETTNLYTAFLSLALRKLSPRGQLVAIVPRSFCNGTYFRGFRRELNERVAIRQIHIFHSRTKAFKADKVLQENIIFSAARPPVQRPVLMTSSEGLDFQHLNRHRVDYDKVLNTTDPELFINIATSEKEQAITDAINSLPDTLESLGIEVMTGPIVDFRNRATLVMQPEDGDIPLIYPLNLKKIRSEWPIVGKKPQGLRDPVGLGRYILPNGNYVVTRRFSSKEEKRRVVASLHNEQDVPSELVGFENKLNVFHRDRAGMDLLEAKGLWAWLNSSLFDKAFRIFSGHTQVNATDLRNMRYPSMEQLVSIGRNVNGDLEQAEIDSLVEKFVPLVSHPSV